MEFRTRFWMGWQIVDKKPQFALPAGMRIPESVPAGLFEHCILEYSNLRVLLPEIYAEMGGVVAEARRWRCPREAPIPGRAARESPAGSAEGRAARVRGGEHPARRPGGGGPAAGATRLLLGRPAALGGGRPPAAASTLPASRSST